METATIEAPKSTHVGRTTDKDHYETPEALWVKLQRDFEFNVDCAASLENTKCADFYSLERSFLTAPVSEFRFKRCWLNCPFSQKLDFLSRAALIRSVADVVATIVPNNARETDWWWLWVKNHADEIVNLSPRVYYELDGVPQKNVPFSSCLVIYYPRIVGAHYGPPRETYWQWN